MSTYTSTRPTLGGTYEVGFVITEDNRTAVDINVTDEEYGLDLTIYSVLYDENGDEENRERDFELRIPEDERTDFANYLREVANMIDRPRSLSISPVRSPRSPSRGRSPSPALSTVNLIRGNIRGFTSTEAYEINGIYYTTYDLTLIDTNRVDVGQRISIDLSILTSKPILLKINNGWIILMSEGDQIRIVSSSENALDQPIYGLERLEVPDIQNSYTMDLVPVVLERFNLPDFNERLIEPLITEMQTRSYGFQPTYTEVFAPRSSRSFSPASRGRSPSPALSTSVPTFSQRISSDIYFVIADTARLSDYSMYEIGRKYYLTTGLNFVDPVRINRRIRFDLSTLTSKPLEVETSDGEILLMTDGDQIRIIGSSSADALDQPIVTLRHLKVPDLSSYSTVDQLPDNLPELNLPDFNRQRFIEIDNLTENRTISYNELLSSIEFSSRGMSPRRTLSSPRRSSSPATQIVMNDLLVNFISFEEISNMLNRNQIERYIIDPSLQYLTTSPNSVLTMFGKNGMTYLVRARYDQTSNQIFQPI